jgi:hypothetical protein
MHHTRPLLVAGALVLAVGICGTIALTTRETPTATTATPPTVRPAKPTTAPADPPTSSPPRKPDGSREAARAVATARGFLAHTGPYAVVVRLQRLPAGWWVLEDRDPRRLPPCLALRQRVVPGAPGHRGDRARRQHQRDPVHRPPRTLTLG